MTKSSDYVMNSIYANHLQGGKAMFQQNETILDFEVTRRMYIRILTELATNRFKWSNMPETVDVRFMELTLFYNALSVFYFDNDYDSFFALQGTPQGRVNMLDQPTAFRVSGNNFVSKTLSGINRQVVVNDEVIKSEADCVPIWSNYLRMPDLDIVHRYAKRLANLDITVDINSENARQPRIIVADESMRLSASNVDRQIQEGAKVIKIDSNMGQGLMPVVLDMGVHPDNFEKIHVLRTRIWNECMGLLGIDNANQDKKERLVESEVDANAEQIANMKAVNLNERKLAARKIANRFGIPVEVEYNSDIDPQLPALGEMASA